MAILWPSPLFKSLLWVCSTFFFFFFFDAVFDRGPQASKKCCYHAMGALTSDWAWLLPCIGGRGSIWLQNMALASLRFPTPAPKATGQLVHPIGELILVLHCFKAGSSYWWVNNCCCIASRGFIKKNLYVPFVAGRG